MEESELIATIQRVRKLQRLASSPNAQEAAAAAAKAQELIACHPLGQAIALGAFDFLDEYEDAMREFRQRP